MPENLRGSSSEGGPNRKGAMGYDRTLRVWRGDRSGGELGDYTVAVEEGTAGHP